MQFSSFSYTSALIIPGKLRSISRDKAVGKEGRGEGRFSYFAYKEMCRPTRYGFWVFCIQFQVAIMHFYQPACPLKALLKFRANYSGASYFSGRSYFKPVPRCTYTLINDLIYPRTLWLSALEGYSIMAYTRSFRQRGAFFRLNVYKR